MIPLPIRRSFRTIRLVCLFAVTVLAAAACDDSGGPSTVVEVEIVTVPNNQPLTSLVPGTTRELLGVPVNARGDFVDKPVTWASSKPAVVAVDAAGLATALAGGKAYIRATADGRTDSIAISVRNPVGTITLAPPTFSLTRQGTQTLTATVRDTAGVVVTDRAITWTSSDTAIAKVNGAGVVTASAVNEGPATITATASNVIDGGTPVNGIASVTVAGAPVVHQVTISGGSGFRGNTGTVALTATATSGLGDTLPATITWTSNDATVATVDAAGLVTLVGGADTVVITANAAGQGVSGSDVTRSVTFFVATRLLPGDSLVVPDIAQLAFHEYAIFGGAADSVQLQTFAGTSGDVDMYLFAPGVTNITVNNAGGTQASAPNGFNGWMCRPWQIGSVEQCRRVLSTAGWYRIRLYAYNGAGTVSGVKIRYALIP